MAKSRSDLVHRALKNLGVLPQGQTPGAEEYNQVDALIDPMIEDLIARDIVFIEDVDAIDEKYFLHLGHVLAGLAQSEFGMQNDPALTARARRADEDLDEMDRNTLRYLHTRTMRTDYPIARVVTTTT
jgi:alpha-ketoglutarate-dependent taurine dioxygenase